MNKFAHFVIFLDNFVQKRKDYIAVM